MQRSPGVFFDQSFHPNGTKIFLARIIPFRGSWVDFTTDIYDCIYAIIDRRRKFPASILLRAIGFSKNADIFKSFGLTKTYKITNSKNIIDKILLDDIIDLETGEVLFEKNNTIDKDVVEFIKKNGEKEIDLLDDSKENEVAIEVLLNTMAKDPTIIPMKLFNCYINI